MGKYNLVTRQDGSVCVRGSLEEQFELLKRFGLPPTAAETQRVRIDIVNGRNQYTLVKRAHPITIFQDDGGRMRSVNATNRTGADRSGFNRKRGKYGDEDRLTDAQLYGGQTKVGDVAAWSPL